ncbi:MAG: hypothetical protein ABL907_00135 [Hyphomicrobium sp.]
MANQSVEDFSAVIEAIYDCALDPDKSRDALPRIANLLDSASSTFAVHDTGRGDGQRYFDWGIPDFSKDRNIAAAGTGGPSAALVAARATGLRDPAKSLAKGQARPLQTPESPRFSRPGWAGEQEASVCSVAAVPLAGRPAGG